MFLKFLAFDYENPNSIFSCLRTARQNARSIREIISSDMWLQLNKSYLMVGAVASQSLQLDALQGFFEDVKAASHLFNGVTEATMTHGEGWHFCRLGKQLERADKTSRILDAKYFILLRSVSDVGTAWDDIQWAAVLRSTSAFEMYRKDCGPHHSERGGGLSFAEQKFSASHLSLPPLRTGIPSFHFRN
jgi:uncharacterized alpha-E superfamily protein